jgi:hypothetical protein
VSDFAAFLQIVLGAVLVAAASAKQFDRTGPTEFLEAMGLSRKHAKTTSMALTFVELSLGVALLTLMAPAITSYLAAGLLGLFLLAMVYADIRNITVSCKCFGVLDVGGGPRVHTMRTASLFSIALVTAALASIAPSSPIWLARHPEILALGLVSGLGVTVGISLSESILQVASLNRRL